MGQVVAEEQIRQLLDAHYINATPVSCTSQDPRYQPDEMPVREHLNTPYDLLAKLSQCYCRKFQFKRAVSLSQR